MADATGWVSGYEFNPITGEISLAPTTFLPQQHYRRGSKHGGHPNSGTATRYTTPYVLFFRPAFEVLKHDRTVKGLDMRVLFSVIGLIDHKHHQVPADYPTLAAEHGITVRTVMNSVQKLVRAGLLTRPERGKLALNPEFIWCGGAARREQLVAKEEEPYEEP